MLETVEDHTGRCHICQQLLEVRYCTSCGHWFCEGCRGAYFRRGLAWLMELVGVNDREGCCGP